MFYIIILACFNTFELLSTMMRFNIVKYWYYFSCDGSFEVMSLITTEISQGVARGASKYDLKTVSIV